MNKRLEYKDLKIKRKHVRTKQDLSSMIKKEHILFDFLISSAALKKKNLFSFCLTKRTKHATYRIGKGM